MGARGLVVRVLFEEMIVGRNDSLPGEKSRVFAGIVGKTVAAGDFSTMTARPDLPSASTAGRER